MVRPHCQLGFPILRQCADLHRAVKEFWIFPIHREWDGLTLGQMFPPESRRKNLMHLVQTELTNLRDQIAHSIMRSGELSLSADDLVQIQRVNKWLPLTRSIARRMLRNDFPTQFLLSRGRRDLPRIPV